MHVLNRLSPILFALLLIAPVLTGCERQSAASTPTSAPPPPEVGVVVIAPKPVAIMTELSGRTAPCLIAEVRPQVGGIIQRRYFDEGAEVEAGQALYQIDAASYQAAVDSAAAELARAEARLTPARLKAERFGELIAINAISRQELDEAEAAFRLAEAEVAAARAVLKTARIDLDYTTVKAPISGRIGRSTVTTGALVTASQDAPLATIQQLDPIYVDVTQSSAEMLALKRNLASGLLKNGDPQQAEVRLLLEDGTPYSETGTLKFSEVEVDSSTGSVTLRTLFPNPQQLLLPGMFARVLLLEGVNEQAILVPQRGVSRDPAGNAQVMVVNAEEKVEPRTIRVERTVDDNWLVSAGLDPGERIILEGFQRARPGTTVKAVPFGEPAPAASPAAAD